MKPNRTFPAVPNDIREWTRFLSDLFYEDSFETTLSDGTSETGTARYTVSAGIVCLRIPTLLVTSTDGLAFLTNLPAKITPERDQFCMARSVDNGVTVIGLLQIGTDTGITLYADLDAGAFTASGTKGIETSIVTYALD